MHEDLLRKHDIRPTSHIIYRTQIRAIFLAYHLTVRVDLKYYWILWLVQSAILSQRLSSSTCHAIEPFTSNNHIIGARGESPPVLLLRNHSPKTLEYFNIVRLSLRQSTYEHLIYKFTLSLK